jgi:AcrR family transcriptional regulator
MGTPDPRITRTARAFEQAVVELAAQRPVSQVTVADLAERAGVTRATFYNRYSSPLELLIQVLDADLERCLRLRETRQADDRHTVEQVVRLTVSDVADHVERSAHPDLPRANHQVIAQFFAYGFAGAIKAWLSDDTVTKADLVEAAVACVPAWWN